MPLSPPAAARDLLHSRDIALRGYERADGLFDIEAQLTDTKSYGFDSHDRGRIGPNEPLHGMWLRLTVDEDLVIHACEAASDHTPYAICPQAAPNFSRLAGLRIGPGFNRAVNERVGGVEGCTHLRELLAQMATVAFQTIQPVRRRRREAAAAAAEQPKGKPEIVGTCLAWAPGSPVVRRVYPHLDSSAAE
jgi:hypothetical protein